MSSTPLPSGDTLLADAIASGASESTPGTGALGPAAATGTIVGTAGKETLNGSADADQIFGLAGNDTLNGLGGNDTLSGGDGNDVLTGGTGDDQLFGDAGDDRVMWNEGDGNDIVEGGDGIDRVQINGDGSAETIQILANGARVFVAATSGAVTSTLDIGTVENLVVSAGDGDDTIVASNGLSTLIGLTLDGGAGNDTMTGGDGADTLLGGSGDDLVTGGRGNDVAKLGTGNDAFVWNPGDGSDVVEGNGGSDTLQFNGSNVGEDIVLAASGTHALLTRNVGTVTMDLHGMETLNLRALGGTDNITVGDLRSTDVKQVNIDLAPFGGGDDLAADTVTLAGTADDDTMNFTVQAAGPATVNGLGAQVSVSNLAAGDRFVIDGGAGTDTVTANGTGGDDVIAIAPDGTNVAVFTPGGPAVEVTGVEQLLVKGGAGNDTITASNGIATLTQLTIDGGGGNDTLLGGDGNDVLIGGAGSDFVDGNRGNDTATLGDGNDVFGWDPGDGSDVVEGNGGTDTLQFNGSNAGEGITLGANGDHAVLTRDIASIMMDLHGMEIVNVRALGSADNITIGDLRGTDVKEVHVDLAGFDGNDDGAADTVTVALTAGDDALAFAVPTSTAVVNALGAQVFVENQGAGDRFVIDGGAGIDAVTANGTSSDDVIGITRDGTNTIAVFTVGQSSSIDVANVEQLKVLGGNGNDTIVAQNGIAALTQLTIDGGAGNDTLRGGDGNDVLLGGSGNDFVDGNIGADTADLGAGNDIFQWDPGDGNDLVEGGSGTDTLQFNGSNAGEAIAIGASGSHAILTRNIANITTDLHGMEAIAIRALGSADSILVGDLRGTDVDQVRVDLAGFDGNDDQAADTVTVALSADNDALTFTAPTSGTAVVNGLGAQVLVEHQGVGDHVVIDGGSGVDSVTASGTAGDDVIGLALDGSGLIAVFGPGQPAIDVTNVEQLKVSGGDGNDTITAGNGIATLTQLTIDGGEGNDTLQGGDGNDTLLGGAGNDFVDGNRGNDTANLGGGDDVFSWDPGDGNDVVEGGAGSDTLQLNASNASEHVELAAGGSHVVLTRDIASITMDLHGMETVNLRALGGTDDLVVHDLKGTDVRQVNIDLGGTAGGGDGANDVVTLDGTAGNDAIKLSLQDGALVVDGLSAQVTIQNFEAGDQIRIFGLGGDDIIDASALPAGASIVLDGGDGDDVLLGGAGNDALFGGAGDDVLIGGPGLDTLDGGGGDNVLIPDGGALLGADLHTADVVEHAPLMA